MLLKWISYKVNNSILITLFSISRKQRNYNMGVSMFAKALSRKWTATRCISKQFEWNVCCCGVSISVFITGINKITNTHISLRDCTCFPIKKSIHLWLINRWTLATHFRFKNFVITVSNPYYHVNNVNASFQTVHGIHYGWKHQAFVPFGCVNIGFKFQQRTIAGN